MRLAHTPKRSGGTYWLHSEQTRAKWNIKQCSAGGIPGEGSVERPEAKGRRFPLRAGRVRTMERAEREVFSRRCDKRDPAACLDPALRRTVDTGRYGAMYLSNRPRVFRTRGGVLNSNTCLTLMYLCSQNYSRWAWALVEAGRDGTFFCRGRPANGAF